MLLPQQLKLLRQGEETFCCDCFYSSLLVTFLELVVEKKMLCKLSMGKSLFFSWPNNGIKHVRLLQTKAMVLIHNSSHLCYSWF